MTGPFQKQSLYPELLATMTTIWDQKKIAKKLRTGCQGRKLVGIAEQRAKPASEASFISSGGRHLGNHCSGLE